MKSQSRKQYSNKTEKLISELGTSRQLLAKMAKDLLATNAAYTYEFLYAETLYGIYLRNKTNGQMIDLSHANIRIPKDKQNCVLIEGIKIDGAERSLAFYELLNDPKKIKNQVLSYLNAEELNDSELKKCKIESKYKELQRFSEELKQIQFKISKTQIELNQLYNQ